MYRSQNCYINYFKFQQGTIKGINCRQKEFYYSAFMRNI